MRSIAGDFHGGLPEGFRDWLLEQYGIPDMLSVSPGDRVIALAIYLEETYQPPERSLLADTPDLP